MSAGLPARFWDKVEPATDDPAGCWLWTAGLNTKGYGTAHLLGKKYLAHRAAYTCLVGDIPPGLQIDHLCRVRNCVNPAHLEPVTNQVNADRGARATQTHCRRGHEMAGDNLRRYTNAAGWTSRFCVACGKIRASRAKATIN